MGFFLIFNLIIFLFIIIFALAFLIRIFKLFSHKHQEGAYKVKKLVAILMMIPGLILFNMITVLFISSMKISNTFITLSEIGQGILTAGLAKFFALARTTMLFSLVETIIYILLVIILLSLPDVFSKNHTRLRIL